MSSSHPSISRTEILDRRVELEPQLLPALPIERILHACRLLWEERRFCLRLLLVALVGSIVVSLLLPPTYESNAVLIPSEPPSIGAMAKMGSLGNIASLAAGGGELMGMRAPEARFIAVLRSRTVADRLIDRFGLMTVYGTSLREGAWQALANHTVIIADRKTGLIFLTVQDRDRYRAARTVVLRRNYRSLAPILDASYRLVRFNDPDRLEVRAGISKQLRSERATSATSSSRAAATRCPS